MAYTLSHLDELVVKPVGESGGYGICVGPKATKAELDLCRDQLKANPSNYISQPMIELSVCPTLCAEGVEPRHVDLAALRGHRRGDLAPAGRPNPRRASQRLHRREFEPGRRNEGTWVLKENGA